jgi:AraC family L-rhamnose operon regulatory protein RhaS
MQEGKIELHALSKGHYPGITVPANVLPGLSSIGFWDAGGAQDWGEDPHRNEGIEIVFLEKGTTPFVIDSKTFHLQAGNFTIARPWQLHKFGAPNIGPCRLHWLILDVGVRRPHQDWRWPKWIVLAKDDLTELTRKLRHNENPVWNSTAVIRQAFRELARNLAIWKQAHAVSRVAVQMNQLLIGILDALTQQQTQENEQLTSWRRAVEIFLHDLEEGRTNAGEAWTSESMAAHCSMGVTTFSKYCRELVNAGPMEFLNQCRLERAARQLREQTGLSVTEVAFANGFNSSQYFASCFRRRFQVSPSQLAGRSRRTTFRQR